MLRHGMKVAEHAELVRQGVTAPYSEQKGNAGRRGIAWKFSLKSWWELWKASGKWEHRGRCSGQYVMARFGDVGPYSPDNVEIVLASKNVSDGRANHPEVDAARSLMLLGRGRGWTFVPRNRLHPYQVTVAHKFIGTFASENEATAAYRAATRSQ